MRFEFSREQKEKLAEYCREKPEILAVYIHGSQVRGNAAVDSDTDVVVVLSEPYKPEVKTIEWGKLDDLLGINELDLKFVTVRYSSPVFIFAVIKYGVCVYSKTTNDKILFESQVLRMYYDAGHRMKIYSTYLQKSILSYAS